MLRERRHRSMAWIRENTRFCAALKMTKWTMDSMEMPRFWRPINQISQDRFVKEVLLL
jgi:hypothetical protein